MNTNIQELSLEEIDAVSGAGWLDVMAIGDAIVEFSKGFVEGVEAAR